MNIEVFHTIIKTFKHITFYVHYLPNENQKIAACIEAALYSFSFFISRRFVFFASFRFN